LQVTNFVEIATNNMLNEIVDTAVRQAVILQCKANKEYKKQKSLELAGEPYNYTTKHQIEEGVSAVCHVLWKIFGSYPAKIISTIEKITEDNNNDIFGLDCQDYTELFIKAFNA
jgi:hypothetical protein